MRPADTQHAEHEQPAQTARAEPEAPGATADHGAPHPTPDGAGDTESTDGPTTRAGSQASEAGREVERHLLPHHREHLKASGLTDATIDASGCWSVTDAAAARHLLGWRPEGAAPSVPALVIPYPDTEDYARLRPDAARTDDKGKPIKYEAPVGRPTEVYIPVQLCRAIEDARERLWLTEGEKKAMAGCEIGLPTVAAAGVYGFHDVAVRNQSDEWHLNKRLHPLVTPGREIVVVFDSDIDSNWSVATAAARLVAMLAAVGSRTSVAYIEPGIGGRKRGLDDLVVDHAGDRAAARRELEESRRPTTPDELLVWLGKAWRDWGPSRQTAELKRALRLLQLESKESLQMWMDAASKKLKLRLRDMQVHLEGAHGPDMHVHATQAGRGTPLPGYPAPPGFLIDEGGIWKLHDDRAPTSIAPAPMTLAAVGVDSDGVHYWTLRWRDRGREREQTVPRSLASGPDLIQLAERGAPVNTTNRSLLTLFFQRQEQNLDAPVAEEQVFTHAGWQGDLSSFVLGRQVIGKPGRIYEIGDPGHLDAQRPRGDLRTYLDLVRQVIAESPEAEAGWASGYVGPLLRLLQQRSLLLSYWGSSGAGKSAVQSLALSPWGRPEGLMITGDASTTAIEATLARTRDLITWIDDTQQTRSSGVLDQLAYQVGGGTGRARGTATGGIRPVANWRTVAFVSGERPLLKLGAAAGAQNRTLDVKVAPIRTPGLARHVHQTLANHHGHTGPMFIQGLLRDWVAPNRVADLRARHRQFMSQLTPEINERAGHVALLMTATWLARVFVLGQDSGGAEAAAVRMGAAILELASSTADGGVHPVEAGYESIVAWVAENDQFFHKQAQKQYGVFVEPHEVGAGGHRVVAVLPGPLMELARRDGFNLMEVLHGLFDRKLMIPGEPNPKGGPRLGKKTPALGESRPRAYWIIMPGGEDPPPSADDPGGTGAPPDRGGPPAEGSGGTRNQPGEGRSVAACPTVPKFPTGDPSTIKATMLPKPEKAWPTAAAGGTGGTGGTARGAEGGRKEEDQDPSSTPPPSPGEPCAVPGPVPARRGVGHIEVGHTLSPRWELVDDADRVRAICEQLSRHRRLALDVETFGRPVGQAAGGHLETGARLHPQDDVDPDETDEEEAGPAPPDDRSALDPFANAIRLVQLAGEGTPQYLFDVARIGSLPAPLMHLLADRARQTVGYNLAFDAKMLLHHYGLELGNPVDLYAGSVLAAGYADHRLKGHYTLKAVVGRQLGIDLPKEQARSDWSLPTLAQEQLEYAARDVVVLLPLQDRVRAAAAEAGVIRAWGLENDVIIPVAAMELAGFGVDREHVQRLIDRWAADAAAAARDVRAVLGDINLNATGQVLKALRAHCGVPLASTSASVLGLVATSFPVIQRLMTYRQATKMIGTYGLPWLEMSQRDGRIHASFHPLAAPTGRFGCSGPNIQAVPRDEIDPTTGKPDPARSIRRAFIGTPDLIVADYNAIELRVLASEIEEPALTACFTSDPPVCPHRRTASVVARKPITDITSSERTAAKAVNFGFCYGMGADRFVEYARDTYGVQYTRNEARAARAAYLRTYGGVAAWHRRSQNEGPRLKEVRTASGRLRRFHQEPADFPHSQYLNTRIQGTAADGLKRTMHLLHPELRRLGARLVNVVHDEVVLDCPSDRREEARKVLEHAMVMGMAEFMPRIPVVVEVAVSSTWTKP